MTAHRKPLITAIKKRVNEALGEFQLVQSAFPSLAMLILTQSNTAIKKKSKVMTNVCTTEGQPKFDGDNLHNTIQIKHCLCCS